MANISFADYENKKSNNNTSNKEYKVGYFSLKDDGDDAVVRFAYSSVQEFNIVTVHVVKTTGKDGKELYKRVSCLREAHEPMAKCPLCLSGNKVVDKFYVKLIEYVKDDSGNIVPKARVWERPAKFARELKSFMDEYGDLTNFVFKVKRRGTRGSTDTTYDIIPVRQEIYKPEIYVKDFTDFEGFKMAGSFYLVKTADELNTFLKTGEFPRTEAIVEKTGSYSRPAVSAAPVTPKPAVQPTTPAPEQPKPTTGQSSPIEGRPQRYKF
jgi:hypothetical protein